MKKMNIITYLPSWKKLETNEGNTMMMKKKSADTLCYPSLHSALKAKSFIFFLLQLYALLGLYFNT